jgi:hypothetical protein
MGVPTNSTLIVILSDKVLNMANVKNMEFMLGQTLNHSM